MNVCEKALFIIPVTLSHQKLRFMLLFIMVFFSACSERSELANRGHRQHLSAVDGDTVRVTEGEQVFKVDLAYIDAPEPEQPYGRQATLLLDQFLRQYQGGPLNPDGPVVLASDKGSINLQMVSAGAAWVKAKNLDEPVLIAKFNEAETLAKQQLSGIWKLEHALRIPPWVWRQQGKQKLPPVRRTEIEGLDGLSIQSDNQKTQRTNKEDDAESDS